jgi:hypothetical protein
MGWPAPSQCRSAGGWGAQVARLAGHWCGRPFLAALGGAWFAVGSIIGHQSGAHRRRVHRQGSRDQYTSFRDPGG